ncbi:MAG: cysteine--tRNA ligase [Deltaproteobacteria bacterium]|nr:cysteine--tRNA ligase [Deltaproteobacteria bacterium]
MEIKFGSILDHIGATPLVRIRRINPFNNVEILAKLESFNPGGSIKDRPALRMIEDAEKTGELTKDKIILEATSGNTGIGLSLVASVKGYRIHLIMSEAVSDERKNTLRAMGAKLRFTPAHMGTDGAIEAAYNLIREEPDKYWLADQYNNESNWKSHYNGTSTEIWEQTGGNLDFIVATMGTTGTLMGISRRFKELKPDVRIIGIEPYLGHKIQGLKNMNESYRPGIFDKKLTDRIIKIDDEEAYHTARILAKKEGLFVGMSSGAAMAGALKLAGEIDKGTVVVILPDGGDRYLSTPLFVDKKKSGLMLYNTLTRRKEEFSPVEENRVKIYSCGPTLSRLIPVEQCRRLVFSDLVKRYFGYRGYKVTHVMNVTDLDDRTIKGAEEAGNSLKAFTEGYYQEFMRDLATLNIEKADAYPKASEHVQDMITLTQKLLEKGYAYEKLRSIYFDISRFKDYGKLSNVDLEKIKVGKTVDLDQYEKENPRDFTLLKRSTLSELKKGIFFKTAWGNIRPSWHLECSAMSSKYLGKTYDIHISGIDLVFPHHENIIAINQAVSGRIPANYWLHNELVKIKRGKSAEIFPKEITIRHILEKGYTGKEIRYWLISRHYRKPISFSWVKLDTAKKTVSNLDKFIVKLQHCSYGQSRPETDQLIYDLKYKFTESMDDDFNIAPALAALFQFTREVNRIMDKKGLSEDDKAKFLESLEVIDSVLGIMDLTPLKSDKSVESIVEEREKARKTGDWATADRLRNELKKKGVELSDTKDGTIWSLKNKG